MEIWLKFGNWEKVWKFGKKGIWQTNFEFGKHFKFRKRFENLEKNWKF